MIGTWDAWAAQTASSIQQESLENDWSVIVCSVDRRQTQDSIRKVRLHFGEFFWPIFAAQKANLSEDNAKWQGLKIKATMTTCG